MYHAVIKIWLLAFVLTKPAYAENSPMNPNASDTWIVSKGGNIASIASHYVGKTASEIKLPRRLWCADFLNYIRKKAGLRPSPSRRAIDQRLNAIVTNRPEPGSIMIHGRRGGSHAALIVSVLGNGTVETIEGNVSGRVQRRIVPIRGKIVKPL